MSCNNIIHIFAETKHNNMNSKPIEGYSNYLIYDDSRIFNQITQAFIVSSLTKRGYRTITLFNGDEIGVENYIKTFYLHRLVAKHFVNKELSSQKWVKFIDGDRFNCNASNLLWETPSNVIKHSYTTHQRVRPIGKSNWNYGKKASKETKLLMSISKKGINNSNFKGWYIINGSKFASAPEAASKTGFNARTIIRKCKSGKDKDFYFLPSKPTTNG